jgi:hypothetical protein
VPAVHAAMVAGRIDLAKARVLVEEVPSSRSKHSHGGWSCLGTGARRERVREFAERLNRNDRAISEEAGRTNRKPQPGEDDATA